MSPAPEVGQAKARKAREERLAREADEGGGEPKDNDPSQQSQDSPPNDPPQDPPKESDKDEKKPDAPPSEPEQQDDNTVALEELPDEDLFALAKSQEIEVPANADRDGVMELLKEAGITRVLVPPPAE